MTDVQTYGHSALQALNATFSKEQAETLLALLAAVGGGGGSLQDLQSVLDAGNESSVGQEAIFHANPFGTATWASISGEGFSGGFEIGPGVTATFHFGGVAWNGDMTAIGGSEFSIQPPAGTGNYTLFFPSASGTLVADSQLAAATGAAGIGYDNAASGLSAADVQAAIDELAQDSGGIWTEITQAAYDALDPPDPNTLYVVIG